MKKKKTNYIKKIIEINYRYGRNTYFLIQSIIDFVSLNISRSCCGEYRFNYDGGMMMIIRLTLAFCCCFNSSFL